MKLAFIYSRVYFNSLNKYSKCSRSWEEVVKIGRKFEAKYKSEINKIIKIIPEVVGKPWKKEIIEVYLVDWKGPSFSHPLTLKVRDDLLLMWVILTHELLHDFYKNEQADEEKINKDVKKVFEKLKINAKEQIEILKRYCNKGFLN